LKNFLLNENHLAIVVMPAGYELASSRCRNWMPDKKPVAMTKCNVKGFQEYYKESLLLLIKPMPTKIVF
jgi:hypothetical protein